MSRIELFAADFPNGYTYMGISEDGPLTNCIFLKEYITTPTQELMDDEGNFDVREAIQIYEGASNKKRFIELQGSMAIHYLM